LRDSHHSTKVFACLLIVYLVWGSSFLFTKIAVANLPPALFAGIRFVTAGVLLALLAEFYGGGRLPTRLTAWYSSAMA
jgi:drug/metabolite transporter (DMT)-like permease